MFTNQIIFYQIFSFYLISENRPINLITFWMCPNYDTFISERDAIGAMIQSLPPESNITLYAVYHSSTLILNETAGGKTWKEKLNVYRPELDTSLVVSSNDILDTINTGLRANHQEMRAKIITLVGSTQVTFKGTRTEDLAKKSEVIKTLFIYTGHLLHRWEHCAHFATDDDHCIPANDTDTLRTILQIGMTRDCFLFNGPFLICKCRRCTISYPIYQTDCFKML